MLPDVLLQTGQTSPLVVLVVVVVSVVVVGVGFAYQLVVYGNLGGASGSDSAEPKTNCPACGARIPADREDCEYCGEPVP